MLCQIEMCCRYGETFDRIVVVQTNHARAAMFRDSFDNYFVSRDKRLVLNARDLSQRYDRMDVYPAFLRGRLSSYFVRNSERNDRLVDRATGLPPSFDFDKDYAQPLLVHHNFGGGQLAKDALGRIQLNGRMAAELERRRRSLPAGYTALHIRHTDIKSRYRGRLHALADEIRDPIFVATDNPDSLAHCRQAFGQDRVVSFANIGRRAGRALHLRPLRFGARSRNTDAILDLLLLALADRTVIFELEPNPAGARYSGFSLLALDLASSPAVVRALLSSPSFRP
jgi:hypothetical protein